MRCALLPKYLKLFCKTIANRWVGSACQQGPGQSATFGCHLRCGTGVKVLLSTLHFWDGPFHMELHITIIRIATIVTIFTLLGLYRVKGYHPNNGKSKGTCTCIHLPALRCAKPWQTSCFVLSNGFASQGVCPFLHNHTFQFLFRTYFPFL